MSGLYWQPIHEAITALGAEGDRPIWILAPFIKLDALDRLLGSTSLSPAMKIVVRWRPQDVRAGVSDLEVYSYLRDRGCHLYVHQRIHLKLYVFESNRAISTSGNLTLRGLGYLDPEVVNVEVGSALTLAASDWIQLYRVVGESRLVTPEIYERFAEYLASGPPAAASEPAPDLLGVRKEWTLASLPATRTPQELIHWYLDPAAFSGEQEHLRRIYQDVANYRIPSALSPEDLNIALAAAFRQSSFVRGFVEHLQRQGSLSFGAVSAWIHSHCEDVPLPYRWEVKDSTQALYQWMTHYYSEVHWNQPNYSQVIYWTEP